MITSYWTNFCLICGKLRRAHPTKGGHFAPAYLGGSNKLRASLEFLYGVNRQTATYGGNLSILHLNKVLVLSIYRSFAFDICYLSLSEKDANSPKFKLKCSGWELSSVWQVCCAFCSLVTTWISAQIRISMCTGLAWSQFQLFRI